VWLHHHGGLYFFEKDQRNWKKKRENRWGGGRGVGGLGGKRRGRPQGMKDSRKIRLRGTEKWGGWLKKKKKTILRATRTWGASLYTLKQKGGHGGLKT